MDLGDVVNFIKVERGRGCSTDYRIGVVREDIPVLVQYKKGEVIVYTVHDPSKTSDSERLFWDRDHSRDPATLTVERPYSPEEIRKRIGENNHIFSHSAMVGVPTRYIKKIKGLV